MTDYILRWLFLLSFHWCNSIIIPPRSIRTLNQIVDERNQHSKLQDTNLDNEYARLLSMGYTPCTNESGNCELFLSALLFANYSKICRPVQNDRNITHVLLNPGFMSILELQEVTQTATVNMWMRIQWNDDFLKWDPENFGGLKKITVPLGMTWLPDVVIYQELSRVEPMREEMRRVTVTYNGEIRFYYPAVHRLFCPLQMSRFPFDSQQCEIRFGPWYHVASEMQIKSKYKTADTRMFVASTEWVIETVDVSEREITYLSAPVTEVAYTIHIKRCPTFYITTLVIPTTLIMTVALVGLFSPTKNTDEREEKVSMGITTLLTLSVLLLMVADQMPKSADEIPMIALFILIQLLIVSLASLTTVFIINLQRRALYAYPIPRWLQVLSCKRVQNSKRKFTPIIAFKDTKKPEANILEERITQAKELNSEDWFQVCTRLDSICKYIYLASTFICVLWFLIQGYFFDPQ